MKSSSIKIILVFVIIENGNGNNLIVTTKVGSIRGVKATDGNYNQFMGIPYAIVDTNNPFGKPLSRPVFDGIFDALDDSKICPQKEEFNNTIVGSLDCLNLNIYVPTSVNSMPLPVMVYLYGGAFLYGFAKKMLYGPKYLVRHDVIIVIMNYRLGPYGFMCLDTLEVPGNQGLKDQELALRWIRENIESFGGDVDKITLFGSSHGGIAADYHLLSQGEKLFNRLILQSGTASIPFSVTTSDTLMPLKLVAQLGYSTSDVNKALSIIATTDPALVIEAVDRANLRFGVCVEKTFLTTEYFINDYPINLPVPKADGVSILLGINQNEMRYFVNPATLCQLGDIFFQYLGKYFKFESDELVKLGKIVRRFYIGDEAISEDVMWKLLDFLSDTNFVHPTDKNIKKYLDNGAESIFYYAFSYSGGRNVGKILRNITSKEAGHSDELGYLFEMFTIPEEPSPQDQLVLDRMTTMWTNFAKYGDPTPTTSELLPVKWEGISRDSVYHCLNIDSELSLGKRPFHKRMAFWDLFYEAYGKYERNIRIIDTSSSISMSSIVRVILLIAFLISIFHN